MSSMASPCCLSSLGTANTGPMPISSGSQPATASARNVPSGVSPRCSASFAPMITQAEAPSESWLALPAVMKPPSRTDWSDASPSRVVSGRLPSSLLSVTGSKLSAFVFLSTTFLIDGSGAISWMKRPACGAALALERISVLRLAGDAVARRHDISGLDHRHPQRGFVLLEPVLIDRLAVRILHQADAFEPAAHHHLGLAQHDAVRRHGDRLQARTAETVDGDARDRDRQAGAHRGKARDVLARGALRHGAAKDHVLDLARLDAS